MNRPRPPWQRPTPAPTSQKTPLSADVIVDTALRILDREGVGAMSMRRVAQELGTGPASLYAHVANLAELHELVFDRVVGELPLPTPDPQRWTEQLKTMLFESVTVMRRHSGVARLGFGRIPVLENSGRYTECLLGVLHAGGVPDQYAAWAVDTLGLFVTGAAYEEYVQAEEGQTEEGMREWFDEFGRYLANLPPDRFPNLVRMAPVMVRGGGDERLRFGIDLLVGGLAAIAASAAGRPSSQGSPTGSDQT
jgi:AcrR family transcriptional regulator